MINAEYYKDEILDLINNGEDIAFNKYTKKLMPCEPMPEYDDGSCKDCLWGCNAENPDLEDCVFATIRWLLAEHKEYPILTRFQYISLIKLFKIYDYKWIAKDKNNKEALFFMHKPQKNITGKWWNPTTEENCYEIFTFPIELDNFPFIKWEDIEPWSIEELLKNCEVEE